MNLSKEEYQEIMSLVDDIISAAEMKGYHSHPMFESQFDTRLNKSVAKLDALLKNGMTEFEKMLCGQLQNCLILLEMARNKAELTDYDYDLAIKSANKVLSEVSHSHPCERHDSNTHTIIWYN